MGSPLGAILSTADLVAHEFGVRGLLDRHISTPNVQQFATQILQPNPQRVLYLVSNPTPTDVWLAENDQVAVTFGYRLGATGGLLTRKWRDDLTSVSDELWGVGAGNTAQIYVVEWILL